MQSVKGTRLILEEIQRKVANGHQNSKLLLTMIPREMEEDTVSGLEDELAESLERDFDQEICVLLKGKMLSDVMAKIAESMLKTEDEADSGKEKYVSLKSMTDSVSKLHEITSMEITAEGSETSNMMATTSIREIV